MKDHITMASARQDRGGELLARQEGHLFAALDGDARAASIPWSGSCVKSREHLQPLKPCRKNKLKQ